MKYLTGEQLDRQDRVDNIIQDTIEHLAGKEILWNIENIAHVREAIREVIVRREGALTEQQFYPYVEQEPEDLEEQKNQQTEKEIILTDEQIMNALHDTLNTMDADDIAYAAHDILGGQCWYTNDGLYSFVPDETYGGAFNYLMERPDKNE